MTAARRSKRPSMPNQQRAYKSVQSPAMQPLDHGSTVTYKNGCGSVALQLTFSWIAHHTTMAFPKLPTRKLGQDEVTSIGYGAMGISALYGVPGPDEDRLKVSGFQAIGVSMRT